MFVMYLSNFDSLQRTRAAYYESARFADVFASLKRAPSSLEARIAALPGVESVATRVVADVTLDVPGMAEPAIGRLISVPDRGRPALNDVYLRRGRWVDPTRPDEVLASEVFCDAHGFQPGDRVAAIINGRRRWLTIVGIALSPEYVYAIRPGRDLPGQAAVRDLLDEPARPRIRVQHGGRLQRRVDRDRARSERRRRHRRARRLLEPYGGFGAIPRSVQISAWTLENELRQLQTFGFITPAIFLGVAAFILNVALARALSLQRSQIAALKALGYANRELAWHYIKWALAIAGSGALAGVAAGAWLGSGMIGLYNEFFRFPALDFHLSVGVAVAVGDRQPRGRGAGRAVGRAARGADSAGRSDASGGAGPVSPQRRRAGVAARPHHAGDADDSAQPRASAGPIGDVGDRHRLRRGRAVRRPGVHRRHERADQRAVRRWACARMRR